LKNWKIMNEELIKQKAEDYIKNYVKPFKTVAEKAYIDGMLDAMKYMREKLSEL
jgi:hypothetical protein